MKMKRNDYPVILIHGAAMTTMQPRFYWGRIPHALKEDGVKYFFADPDPWGSLESNGKIVEKAIQHVLRQGKHEKVHLIGHSRGGLEARIAAAGPEGKRIASISTVVTPHHGSPLAVKALSARRVKLYAPIVDEFWKTRWGRNGKMLASIEEMTPKAMEIFNGKYVLPQEIYGQSFSGRKGRYIGDLFYHYLSRLIEDSGDGVVDEASARWENYRGVFPDSGHQYLADTFCQDDGGIDVVAFYRNMVRELQGKADWEKFPGTV